MPTERSSTFKAARRDSSGARTTQYPPSVQSWFGVERREGGWRDVRTRRTSCFPIKVGFKGNRSRVEIRYAVSEQTTRSDRDV